LYCSRNNSRIFSVDSVGACCFEGSNRWNLEDMPVFPNMYIRSLPYLALHDHVILPCTAPYHQVTRLPFHIWRYTTWHFESYHMDYKCLGSSFCSWCSAGGASPPSWCSASGRGGASPSWCSLFFDSSSSSLSYSANSSSVNWSSSVIGL